MRAVCCVDAAAAGGDDLARARGQVGTIPIEEDEVGLGRGRLRCGRGQSGGRRLRQRCRRGTPFIGQARVIDSAIDAIKARKEYTRSHCDSGT